MSFFMSNVTRVSTNQNSFRFLNIIRKSNITQAQLLYTPSALGIDGYLQTRKNLREQFTNYSDKFRSKMEEFVSDTKTMIFTEDLRNMLHIAEPTDLELLQKMIKKFNTQKTEFRFGSFVFGPIVMRMFHFLDAPNEALQCFEDPDNNGFFDQLVSYQILLDLLYNNEMYDEMYRVYDVVKEKQISMTKYPKYVMVLVLAACYKQNTAKSFEYATKLWSEMINSGTTPVRRASTFMASLALKQGAPHLALESIALQKPHYVTIRNIKARALAEMGRVDDAFPVLKAVVDIDSPEQQGRHTFFEETVIIVRDAVKKADNKDLTKEFENIEKALKSRGLIDKQTLDQLVTSEITVSPKSNLPRGMPKGSQRMPFGMRHRKPNF